MRDIPTSGKYKQHVVMLGNRRLVLQGYEPKALKYLLANGFAPEDLLFECENVPKIEYTYGGRKRVYLPDMYVPKRRLVIEVKSEHTLGLLSNTKRGFSMSCAKAIACHKKGFKYVCLLMARDGTRLRLPKNWAKMNKADLIKKIDELNPTRGKGVVGLFQA